MDTVKLQDGTGSGVTAKVNNSNELSLGVISEATKATLRGDAYVALADCTTAGVNEDFFYIHNTSNDDLVIYKIEGWCADTDQEISILLGATDDGTGNGDDVTPENLNAGYANAANMVCVDDGTDLAITGGTASDLLKFGATSLALGSFHYPSGLIVSPNQRLHMNALFAGLINLNVFFYFRTPD